MYSRGIAALTSTGYGAPAPPTGVTCRPSLYTGASGPTKEDVIVVPVSEIPSMNASLGTPFLIGPEMPVILRIKKSMSCLL
jgi:hypothetical protein